MKKKIFFVFLVCSAVPLVATNNVFAEVITLKSGNVIEGELIEKGEDYIKIDFEGLPLTYFFGDIDNIDGKNIFSDLGDSLDNKDLVIGVTDGPEASIIFWKTVIEKKPNDIKAYNNVGFAYSQLGDYKEAIDYFKKAVEIDPNSAVSYSNIGLTYISLKDYPSAVPFLEKAIELDPDNSLMAPAYHGLGANNLYSGKFEEAMPYLKKAIMIDPNFADAYANLGGAYAQLGQMEEAITNLVKAIQINPNHVNAYLNLASCYESQEQKELAKDNYLKARELLRKQGNDRMVQEITQILEKY